MRRALALLVAAVLVVSVSSALAWQRRAVERQLIDDADESDRYVDMGVLLSVVAMDLDKGHQFEPGLPPVRIIRQHRLGGMLDTWTRQIVGPSERPRYWQCSEDQERLILHPDSDPLWLLVQGSEGGGKSVALVMWAYCRVIEHAGHDREMGITAPVFSRLAHVKKAAAKLWDPKWYRWKERDQSYKFRSGMLVQLTSAHQQSEDAGSPIQGANWVACGSDELQDHHDREADIQARGRSAPNGRYKRLCTSTFKDLSDWRTFREVASKTPTWRLAKLLGTSSPFVWPSHWERMRTGGITLREYQRRVLAMDVGPEAQLYHCWSRKLEDGSPGNLRPIPLGAEDVTAQVMAPWGRNISVLVGHDPGKRQHVSMFLKAYRFADDARRGDLRPRWFVVDEVTTPDATLDAHVADVLKRVRGRWKCNLLNFDGRPSAESPQVLVRIDPHTRSSNAHPGQDFYTIWRKAGFVAKAAAYKPNSTDPAQILRESRFNMMNALLCDVDGTRRLFIACDDAGGIAAPHLVKALESMERNAAGEGEADAKDANDLSHWPAAVGYALWQIERPKLAGAA